MKWSKCSSYLWIEVSLLDYFYMVYPVSEPKNTEKPSENDKKRPAEVKKTTGSKESKRHLKKSKSEVE